MTDITAESTRRDLKVIALVAGAHGCSHFYQLVLPPLAGFASGVTTPSRDMLVRGATPAGATGKVFGFVYSGLDLGAAATPPVLGFFLDRGEPRMVFVLAAAALALTILTAFRVGKVRAARLTRAEAAPAE